MSNNFPAAKNFPGAKAPPFGGKAPFGGSPFGAKAPASTKAAPFGAAPFGKAPPKAPVANSQPIKQVADNAPVMARMFDRGSLVDNPLGDPTQRGTFFSFQICESSGTFFFHFFEF